MAFGLDNLFSMGQDILGSVFNNTLALDRQHDAQNFSADQAAQSRSWQEEMSNTQYQRQVADLSAAGLNPMLAYMKGGASTPSGATATSGIASTGSGVNLPGAAATASQINLQNAQEDSLRAQAEKTKAEEAEIRARTPTHAVSIEQMKQQMEQSKAEIQKIIQDTSTSGFTAKNLEQQTENLRAQLPQIEAMINNLKAMTRLSGAQVGLVGAQTKATGQFGDKAQIEGITSSAHYDEIRQRIESNLPAVEAAFKKLETMIKQGDLPQAQGKGAVYGAAGGHQGALLEFLRAINPLNGIFK